MQNYRVNIQQNKQALKSILEEVLNLKVPNDKKVEQIIRKYPAKDGSMFSKGAVIRFLPSSNLTTDQKNLFIEKFRMKRIRTSSGVTPVTVLTKPFPCPGKCIFCPSDVRMPKSYIASEPGAQRAESNLFDPYYQTHNRLAALKNTGHSIEKVELIILGGTWSSYPKEYQVWFIKRCFDALNDFCHTNQDLIKPSQAKNPINLAKVSKLGVNNSYNQVISKALNYQNTLQEKSKFKDLDKVQRKNELSKVRCVGLVIETRPDEISEKEVTHIRRLGATKVQIGIQSLNNRVLELNKRGHNVSQSARAVELLRLAGFKIHAHYMPNLFGSNPDKDIKDFKKMFSNKSFKVDELKIYPCSLIENTGLIKYYRTGEWKPYNKEQLLTVLKEIVRETPEYCRITRMIRDIPSTEIVSGNKTTNFRQLVDKELENEGFKTKEIRSREIRDKKVVYNDLVLKNTVYSTKVSKEHFLQFTDPQNKIAGFLRLSLPLNKKGHFIKELEGCPIIREIHVYGVVTEIGKAAKGNAQHIGLGKKLIEKAEKISKRKGFTKLAVISSVGTRDYYKKRGFEKKGMYQIKQL